jgi:membrane protein
VDGEGAPMPTPYHQRRDIWYVSQLVWRTGKIAYLRFLSGGGSLFMAAAIAFYSLICLGPLGILMASLLRELLGSGSGWYQLLSEFIHHVSGEAADQIMGQLDELLTSPPSFASSTGGRLPQLLGLGALVWAGLRLFDIIQLSLTTVWPGRRHRHFVLRKLISLAMMAVAGVLLAGFIFLHATANALTGWLARFPGVDQSLLASSPGVNTFALGLALSGSAYLLLYKFMPVQRVSLSAAFVGAALAALIWQALSPIFTSFIRFSLQINPIYGNLSGVVIFGMWSFMGAQVMLLGAHVAAAYQHVVVDRRTRGEDRALIDASWRRSLHYQRKVDEETEDLLAELQLDHPPQRPAPAAGEGEQINGIILAGGRLSATFAEAVGAEHKGLVPLAGRPSIEHLVTALRGLPQLKRLVVVGDKAAYVYLVNRGEVDAVIEESADLTANLVQALRFFADDCRLLLVTTDTPLVTTAGLQAFLAGCDPTADLCFPLTHQPLPWRRRHRRWIFLPLREGGYSHTCNILFDPRLILQSQDFVERFLANHKDYWGGAATSGAGFLLRSLLSWRLPLMRYRRTDIIHLITHLTGARQAQGIDITDLTMVMDLQHPDEIAIFEQYLQNQPCPHRLPIP